jgi:hypothetical protein
VARGGNYVYDLYDSNPVTAISDLLVSANSSWNPLINNNGVVVGQLSNDDGYRKFPDGRFDRFVGLFPRAINEQNAFCGRTPVTTTRPRATTNNAFVYSTSRTLNKISVEAIDLNNSLDSVVVWEWLNHRTLGNLKIINMLDKRAPNPTLTNLILRRMTDRVPGINFPVLCGTTSIGTVDTGVRSFGVHLIPVPAP